MATKKQVLTKKQQKQIKKFAKKNPKVFIVFLVIAIVAALGIGGYLLYKKATGGHDDPPAPIESGEVQINFLELGNHSIGDSTFIKVGDVDILIDAGSKASSAATIESYMKTKMTDNVIEYVIATHAHEDHIAGFVGTNDYGGIFDHYKVGKLIQFSRTNSTSKLYSDYCKKVETLKANGTTVYTADQCIGHPFEIDNKITLEILDQKYYYEKASTENNYSVCCLLNQGSNHYLFTGDLELAGETSLVELNKDLPHCQLFKGGHHGSVTSSNDVLLDKITPETICICTCCGSEEYGDSALFPNQITIDRMKKHTDKIYVTASYQDKEYKPMNGNITFKCINGVDYEVHGSNNDLILKDTDWFKAHRTW